MPNDVLLFDLSDTLINHPLKCYLLKGPRANPEMGCCHEHIRFPNQMLL